MRLVFFDSARQYVSNKWWQVSWQGTHTHENAVLEPWTPLSFYGRSVGRSVVWETRAARRPANVRSDCCRLAMSQWEVVSRNATGNWRCFASSERASERASEQALHEIMTPLRMHGPRAREPYSLPTDRILEICTCNVKEGKEDVATVKKKENNKK